MPYAILEIGGKQYKVSQGETFEVEKMEVPVGQEVILDRILAHVENGKSQIGTPYLNDRKVVCEVVDQVKGKKLIAFKFRPKKHSKQWKGHRQRYTVLRVKEVIGEKPETSNQ